MSVKCVLQDQIKSTFTQEDADNRYIQITEKGSANGVATLGSGGKIGRKQLINLPFISYIIKEE